MAKGATIPIQSLQVQHALTDMSMPLLVHPHHTIETLDCTTGSYNPPQPLMHLCVGRLPLWPQTLTHGLLQCREWRETDAFFTVGVHHRLPQRPQADAGLTPQRVLDGLGQLLMQPIEIMQRPLITEQTPYLAPLWTYQRLGSLTQLLLRPLPIVQPPVGPKDRQSQCNPPHDTFRLHCLITAPLGLVPRPPCLLCHAAGVAA